MKLCKSCGQVISESLLRKKRKLKGQRVSAGLARAKENGMHVGRPKEVDDAEIRRLRSTGLSMRQIAKILGISTCPVQRALKGKS